MDLDEDQRTQLMSEIALTAQVLKDATACHKINVAAIGDNRNQMRWLQDRDLSAWLATSRLDLIGQISPRMPDNPRVRQKALGLIRLTVEAATQNLEKLLSTVDLRPNSSPSPPQTPASARSE